MRASWKGTISFGMVSIPVALGGATEEKTIKFNQLHASDSGRIKMPKVCSACDKAVTSDEIVKGHEYAKGEVVVVTEDELARSVGPKVLELCAFVPEVEVNPIAYKKAYYLEPEASGAKPYQLLVDAMGDKGVVGIARITMREKESLAVLRNMGGVLVLQTMFWPDEVREMPVFATAYPSAPEAKMAGMLVESMTTGFDPAEFRDTYRERLTDLIAAKVAGSEFAYPTEAPVAKVIDLMSALKASVKASVKQAKAS